MEDKNIMREILNLISKTSNSSKEYIKDINWVLFILGLESKINEIK